MSSKKGKRAKGQVSVNDLFKRITDTGKTPNRDTVGSDPISVTTPESAINSSAKK